MSKRVRYEGEKGKVVASPTNSITLFERVGQSMGGLPGTMGGGGTAQTPPQQPDYGPLVNVEHSTNQLVDGNELADLLAAERSGTITPEQRRRLQELDSALANRGSGGA